MKMSRRLFTLFTTIFYIASFILLSECRMGWQNNGNEYWVYTTNTRGNNSIKITGTFSITPVIGIASSNRLIVGKDHNINAVNRKSYLFLIYVGGMGHFDTVVPAPVQYGRESKNFRVPTINSGKAFDFTVTIAQSEGNGTYNHSIKVELRGYQGYTVNTKDSVKWDFDNMELFLGGNYNPSSFFEPDYFHGCFSNILVQGVDIIATYFSQYPNNTNPIRGSKVGTPPYATAMQNCSDVTTVTSTLGPTSPMAKITPTKKPGAAASNKVSVFILLAAICLTLL